MIPQQHLFEADGGMPNSRLPLLFFKRRLGEGANGNEVCALYRRNGWQGTWIYTVYPFWHYHTRGHEVLTCVSGSARIALGSDAGIVAEIGVGDVTVIPAGVGHKRLWASDGFAMAGGYPPGQDGNIVRPGDLSIEEAAAAIARLALPERDPISGGEDGVVAAWRAVSPS